VSAFVHRGVIEGFYGTPWPHADRLWCIERISAWGMNRYVYAPKDDPLHRARWRDPHPADQARELRELVATGDACGVQVGFALSPGLSIHYADAADRAAVSAKLAGYRDLGARFLALALDDVPSRLVHADDRGAFASLAAAHLLLAAEVRAALGDGCTLWLVPTDYLGTGATDYLAELGAGLPPEVEVGWTGRTVLSPSISLAEARGRAAVLRRRVLVWDNTPAADGPMRNMLHLNPYQGRDPGLAECVSGALLNPMRHARASGVTLRTAARYLEDPAGYDAERAFAEATAELGAGAPDAFALFARAHRFSPLACDDRDRELEALFDGLRAAIGDARDPRPALRALREAVAARGGVAERLRRDLADRRLLAEIEPWIASHACETRRISAALDCLAALFEKTLAVDRVYAFFALEAKLSREPLPAEVSYGPRRVLYPQLASLRDDAMALAPDPTLIRDRNLADDIVLLAEAQARVRLAAPPA
jgi:hyaluronoglucosaminidase